MNTVSMIVNGRTAVEIASMPEKERFSITTIAKTPSFAYFRSSSPAERPSTPRRRSSRDSPGWYNTEGGMTLDDFARRLNTTTKRIERWQSACAQSIVMALMRPTPLVLFFFNPISLIFWMILAIWYLVGGSSTVAS